MGRRPCCDKIGLNRGPWKIEEDQKLINFILNNGIQCWRLVPKLAGLMRCGKSCRLRWTNYLRPDLKRGAFSEAEEEEIIELHFRLGNRWSKIASHFPGRTDNEIKNHWHTKIKKRLKLQGLDPVTHQPIQASTKCPDSDSNPSTEQEAHYKTAEIGDDEIISDQEKEKNEVGSASNESTEAGIRTACESLDIVVDEEDHSTVILSSHDHVEGDSSCSLEGSKLCSTWVDTIDSFTSWEALCYLEDVLSFRNYP